MRERAALARRNTVGLGAPFRLVLHRLGLPNVGLGLYLFASACREIARAPCLVERPCPTRKTGIPPECSSIRGRGHALVIHYEDFFRSVLTAKGELRDVQLIPSIAGSKATDFLRAIVDTIPDEPRGPCQPPRIVEGLCESEFTLPFPGAWLVLPPA